MAENATRLGLLGESTRDVSKLLAFELQQASDYQAIVQRYAVGSLGRGQPFIGDIQAVVDEASNVTIQNGSSQRVFTLQADGSHQSESDDYGTLTAIGGSYQIIEQDGTLVAFNADGRLDYIEDPNENRISATYTGEQLTQLADSTGGFLEFRYNGNGRIFEVKDEVDRTTTYTYDATGEFIETVTDETGTTTYSYNNGAIASIVDPEGVQIEFRYDDQGRLRSQSLNDGAETITYSYDSAGGVTLTDADGNSTRLLVNDRGQVGQITDPAGRAVQFRYDNLGNLTRIIGHNNSVTSFTYDNQGNLISQTDANGQQIQFEYEPTFNRLTQVTDPRGNDLRYAYDAQGSLETITYEDGTTEEFDYDDKGNIKEFTNRRGQTIEYTYENGLLYSETIGGTTPTTYLYDDRNNIESVTNSQGTTLTEYHPETDFLAKITYPTGRFLEFDYDDAGRRTRLEDQDGNVVNYEYDAAGRLDRLTDASEALIVDYEYDAVGRLAREDKGNGTYSTYDYFSTGELQSLIHYAPDDSVNARFDYTYDALGRQASMATLDGSWKYGYDAVGQLISAVFDSTNEDIPDQNLVYVYDAAGNRIQSVENGVTTNYVTNNLNQYEQVGDATYEYDDDGNLIRKTDSTGITTYNYNTDNRLARITTPDNIVTEYEYDVFGNRTATVRGGERTEYLIDPFGFGDVVGEYSSNGDLVANYAHGLGLESRSDSDSREYFDFDASASTSGLTDNSGKLVNRYSYTPFGKTTLESESIDNSFEFVGQLGISEEPGGLQFMRTRFYDSDAGRFTTADSIGLLGGDTNLYRYVENSPNNYVDPEGTWAFLIPIAINAGRAAFATAKIIARTKAGRAGIASVLGNREAAKYCDKSYGIRDALGDFVSGAVGAGLASGAKKGAGLALKIIGNPTVSLKQKLIAGAVAGVPIGATSSAIGNTIKGEEPYGSTSEILTDGAFNAFFGAIGGLPYIGSLSSLRAYWKGLVKGSSAGFCPDDSHEYPMPEAANLPITSGSTQVAVAIDPNDIVGPTGIGDAGWITPTNDLPYTVRFENDPDRGATAPAVFVTITHQLDEDLDWDTFELGNFGFNNLNIDVPEGLQNYSAQVEVPNVDDYFVDFEATFDPDTGASTWSLRTLDPRTGSFPNDAFLGFLPVNGDNNEGEGYVNYTIQPKEDLPTGTEITAIAEITFDTNDPISTDEENPAPLNTIDVDAPNSNVLALPTTTSNSDFAVTWSGTDSGSGIKSYDIYVSTDSAPFILWLDDTVETSATYSGQNGSQYSFYSVARDNVGQTQAIPVAAQAVTVVDTSTDAFALTTNAGLTLDEEEAALITNQILEAAGLEGGTTEILYTLTTLPSNGYLQLSDIRLAVGNTFTQTDIDDERIEYVHDGSETISDQFSFTVGPDDTSSLIEADFQITVEPVNDSPVLANVITDQTVTRDSEFSFAIASDTFTDADLDDSLSYSATLVSGGNLPTWLTFDSSSQTFNGTPNASHIGTLDIEITAADNANAIAQGQFELTIINPPEQPNVSGQLKPLSERKILELANLGATSTVGLELNQLNIDSVSELIIFSSDNAGENRTQIASFSLLEEGRLPSNYAPKFSLDNRQLASDKFLQFELVQEGIVRIATPRIDDNAQITLDFGDGTKLTAILTEQSSTQNMLLGDADAIDLTRETGPLNIQFIVYREAKFNNTVGFYTTDDADGSIQDPLTGAVLRPSDTGYKAAAIARQIETKLTGQNGKVSNFSSEVAGGNFLGTFLIVDGSDPLTDDVYFSYAGVNENNNDHVKMLGNNTFGFEDLAGLGDQDFNDTVVQFSIT